MSYVPPKALAPSEKIMENNPDPEDLVGEAARESQEQNILFIVLRAGQWKTETNLPAERYVVVDSSAVSRRRLGTEPSGHQ